MHIRIHLLQGLSVIAFAAAIAATSPATAQTAADSPLAAVPADVTNYPSGERLRSEYAVVNQPLGLPPLSLETRGPTAGLAAASLIQAQLPAGFTLGSGATVYIPEGSAARQTPAAPQDGGETAGASDKYITVYPIQYNGIPLSNGSDSMAMTSGSGTLLVTRRRGLPETVDGTEPSVSAQQAVSTAVEAAKAYFGETQPTASEPMREIWVDDTNEGHLAWSFTLESPSLTEPQARRYWVAALGDGRVLHWESAIYHTHHGTVSGTLWTASPFDGTANRPLPGIQVVRSSDGLPKTTGPDGRYGYDLGVGNADISAALDGPNVDLQNQSGPDMTAVRNGTPDNAIDLHFGPSTDEERAQVTASHWTEAAHELARNILLPTDLPNLITRTNINASCNAFWNGNSINFFKAGGSCPNTAYSDVVFHEYGHGVDARKGGILDGGYSEGFGDAMALLGTRQSCLGRDFFGVGTCLRPATDVILWPPAPGEGVHAIGRRYAGFTWELIQQLAKTYGEDGAYDIAGRLVLAAAAANPSDIPDAVYLSFLADDTDGNLANGTPHFKELAAAADSRNIPRPADPAIAVAGGVGVSAHFPWSPQKTVSTNENILQVNLHLDEQSEVHISANSSAQSATPISFRTGFFNQVSPNVVWTYSYRNVSLPDPNQWANFGSKFSIQLPAGDHTLYWKIWVNGGTLKLSSGTLQVETFRPSGSPLAIAAISDTTTAGVESIAPAAGGAPLEVTTTDESGTPITVLQGN